MPATLATSAGLRATVFGSDPETMAALPARIPLREINFTVDGALPVPDLFWFNRRLRVWFSAQRGPAPLVVVVSAAGGHGNAGNIQLLRRALYGAGYHVLTLPSPTSPRFIVAASDTGVAGHLAQDTADLHRAIRQALAQLPPRLEITGLHAVGYSLGGAHVAMLKALDAAAAEPLGVERVVMINPPVSLYESVSRLDGLFACSIGDDPAAIERFYQGLYADLSSLYREAEAMELDEAFLLGAAGRLLRSDQEFTAAIALSFRMSLINMYFIGDYYAGTGLVVDPQALPRPVDPLDEPLRRLQDKPFSDYFEEVFAPYYLARHPEWTHEDLVTGSSLEQIAATLAADPSYYAQHNADDVILNAQELAWLRRTLGDRLVVYGQGGHLGNIGERRQIEDMLSMLAGDWRGAGTPR